MQAYVLCLHVLRHIQSAPAAALASGTHGEFKHDADCKGLTVFPCKPEAAATTPNAAAIATAEDLTSTWIAAAVKGENN